MNRYLDFFIGIPIIWILRLTKARRSPGHSEIKKILIIKLAAVGDTILLIPGIRSLRQSFPNAKIEWLVSKVNFDIATLVPYVDRVIRLDSFRLGPLSNLILSLRKKNYDVIIDFEQWARGTAILSFLVGSSIRLGFDTPNQHRSTLFTDTHTKTYDDHEVYDFFNLINHLQVVKRDPRLEIWETTKGKIEFDRLGLKEKLKGDRKRVLIQPGCGLDGKRREWPLEQYALLGNWLRNNYSVDIILQGGPEEREKTHKLRKLLNGNAFDVSGQLSWQGGISLLKYMDLIISGNTGIMHLAASLGKKQVALHGPTDERIWGPLNPNARVVKTHCKQCPSLKLGYEYHSKNQDCMKKIEFIEVKEAISKLLEN